jgi:hypothetical protein
VPITRLTEPPDAPEPPLADVELLVAPDPPAELDELDEPPHAASARAAMTASTRALDGLTYFFKDPPPKRSLFFPGPTIYGLIPRVGIVLIKAQQRR